MVNLKKKFMLVVCLLLVMFSVVGVKPSTICASEMSSCYAKVTEGQMDDGYYVLKVSKAEIKAGEAYRVIQEALDTARANASANVPYKVVVEPGTYTLETSLRIYSNTYLDVREVTFNQPVGDVANMLKVGDNEDTAKGYYYKNIVINGGIWNEKGNSNTAIKICHAKNVTLENATLMNCKNSHLMEIAGVDGITIKNCTFKDQKLDTTAAVYTYEAIQLDVLLESHLSGYLSEDLPMKNVKVTGCTFTNVPRGVGSHTAILNNPVDTIEISNNTFTNLKSLAIQAMNYVNCTISNNTITDAPQGIMVYSVRESGTFLASTAVKEGGVKSSTPTTYVTPSKEQKIKILNNTINVSGTDPYEEYENAAIFVSGLNLSKAVQGSGDKIPAGNHYVSDVEIKNNTVTTKGHGIRLQDVKTASICDNTVEYVGSAAKVFYGIQVREGATNNTIENNTITTPISGIHVYDNSTAKSIANNTVTTPKKNGIMVEDGEATSIKLNKISNAGVNGIFVYADAEVGDIVSNAITSPKQAGIDIDDAKVANVTSNTIKNTNSHAIYLHNKANAVSISKNKVTAGKTSINIDGSTVSKISSNKFDKAATNSVYLHNGGKVTTLSSNTITSAKKNGIFVEKFTVTNINNNTISGAIVNGIHVYAKSNVSKIYGNTIKKPGKYGIGVENSTAKTIQKNTIDSPVNTGIFVLKEGKTAKVIENKISSGGARGISINSLKCEIEVSGNNISSCKDYLIYCNPASTKYTITIANNTLKGSKKIDGIRADSGNITLSGNTVKSCNRAVIFSAKIEGSIESNTLSKNTVNKVKVDSKYASNLKKPTVSIGSVKKTSVKVKWKKVSGASGYIVYRSTSQNGTYKKCAEVKKGSTVAYTDKGVKSGKKYYYKVVAYKNMNSKKVVVYSDYSSATSVKTK